MDFSVDAVDFGDRVITILGTRWVNLGSGLDPGDLKW